MFDLVRQSFQAGWYTAADVKMFVMAKMITKDEYKRITGQEYDQLQQPTTGAGNQPQPA